MRSNHPGLLSSSNKLYHISEQPGINRFDPRPSPSFFPGITEDVVFAISDNLLHNYLLPRDCPRVTFYASANTTQADKHQFLANTSADFIIIVESAWYQRIKETTLHLYEFDPEDFTLIDGVAGYYVSYKPVIPKSIIAIHDCLSFLLAGNVELRFTLTLTRIAEAVKASTLNFSLIRMRNAAK